MPNRTQGNVQENQNRADILGSALELKVKDIRKTHAGGSVQATATVQMGELLSIRNVKIKEDDYGYQVVMPRIKPFGSDEYKDAIFFADKSLKEKFDQAVISAYEEFMQPVHEEEMSDGMDEEDFSDDYEETLQSGQNEIGMGM